jgi:hypothetical protein
MGLYGTSTQAPGGSLASSLDGRLGALTIKTDLVNASISTTGAKGTMGNLSVGGSIVAGDAKTGLFSNKAMGNLTLGGSLYGGSGSNSGDILSGGAVGKVTVGGSIFGGRAANTGVLESTGNMGAVAIKGSVIGGTREQTGNVHVAGDLASLILGGSIVGGSAVAPADSYESGRIYTLGGATNNMGPVKIAGSLRGAKGDFSGALFADGAMSSVSIGGSLSGGGGTDSGALEASDGMGRVNITGDARAGAGDYSGSVSVFRHGSISSVTLGGSLVGGASSSAGLIAGDRIGTVNIGGSIRATDPAAGVRISAGGTDDNTGGIKSVAVKGSVRHAVIVAGSDTSGSAGTPDAGIGSVTVGGDWLASSIAAGIDAGVGRYFGDANDAKIPEPVADTIFAKIASITIRGFAAGTPGVTGDHFGLVAERIGSVTIGAYKAPLTSGVDSVGFAITDDLRAREV